MFIGYLRSLEKCLFRSSIHHYSGMGVKNTSTVIHVKECSACISLLRVLEYLALNLGPYFEFIFVYGVRECSNFILLDNCPVFSAQLIGSYNRDEKHPSGLEKKNICKLSN